MGMSGSPSEIKRRLEISIDPFRDMPSFVRVMMWQGFLTIAQAFSWRTWDKD